MAAYTTQAMTGTSLVADILTADAPPAGAFGWAIPDGNGGFIDIALADLSDPAATYTAGAGIAISPANEISATGYTDAEIDALLAPKISKQEADTRYGLLAAENTWQRDQLYAGDAVFASSYLPLRVRLSAFGIVVDNKGPIAVNLGNNYVQFSDGTVSARFALVGGKLIFSGAPIEVPDPTTPQGIASKSYVDQRVGSSAPFLGYVNGTLVGYATFEAACDARPVVLHVRTPTVTLAATSRTFSGVLYANDTEFIVPDGMELRLARNAQVYNANITTPGTGVVGVIGAGTPTGGSVPVPSECLQLIDCAVGNLRFAINSYQGLVMRGNTTVVQLNTDAIAYGNVPAYLFDYSAVTTVYPSFDLLDKRPGAATGGASPTGIDYANPVTLSAAAGLLGNNAYYLTGSGYPLNLPPPGANLGKALYVEVASGATGLYAVGPQLLRASESLIVRATPGGWAISTKQLVPLVARIETALSQQDAFSGIFFVPFSNTVQDAVGMSTAPGITIQRSGQYILTTGGALKSATGNDQNVISLLANPGTGNEQLLVSSGTAITAGGIGDAFVTYTGYLPAGTVLRTRFYCGAGAALRGQIPGAQLFLTVTEIA